MSCFLDIRCDESDKNLTSSCLSFFLSHPPLPLKFFLPPSLPCTFSSSNRSRDASKTGQDALCYSCRPPALRHPPSQASLAPMLALRQRNFHGQAWPGAFTPMPKLSRHKSQPPRTIFHFSPDDSDSSDFPDAVDPHHPLQWETPQAFSQIISLFTPRPGCPLTPARPIRTCDASRWICGKCALCRRGVA